MHFAFSEDQLLLCDAIREALRAECTPERVRASWTSRQPQLWSTLAELGVLGIEVPEDQGGMGMGACEWVLLAEETGRVALPGPVAETLAMMPLLAASGEDDLVAKVSSGQAVVTVAPDGEYVQDADIATHIYRVMGSEVCRVDNARFEPVKSVDGARRLFRVSGDLRSVDGDGSAVARRAVLAVSAQLIGLSEHLLDTAVGYAKERRQFGKPIGSFQAIQHHLADALLKIRFAKPVVYRAAWSVASGDPQADVHVSMAKCYAADAVDVACRKALQVHGAIGYTFEYDLHLWMKRAWGLRGAWGSAASHRQRIGDAILQAS